VPELPEVVAYLEALESRIVGAPLSRIRIASPSVLRSVDPPVAAAEGRFVRRVSRIGKRIVWTLDDELFLVIHLMVAGRLRWRKRSAPIPRRIGHAAFDFPAGSVILTEAGSRKRASLHLVRGEAGLAAHDRGGIEPLEADFAAFRAAMLRENRTMKRALTDPRLVSGIGNAHSDEILWEARLSPVRLTRRLTADELQRLFDATRSSLTRWIRILCTERGDRLPEKVTAFHPKMAVHGRFGEPCLRCARPIQRIVYADRETNYCAGCQTGGRVLADRSLSRLLRQDWPRTLEEMEELESEGRPGGGRR
jgi:formamidopyrimidine-DNA glycosylase